MKKTYLHLLLIVVIGILIYSNTFNAPFHFDDVFYIVEDNVPLVVEVGSDLY